MAGKAVDITQPWSLGEVIFKVGDLRIYANKAILDLSCPELIKGYGGNIPAEIQLPGVDSAAFCHLMNVLHFPHKTVNKTNVYLVLPLTVEYKMDQLTAFCEQLLMSITPSSNDARKSRDARKDYSHYVIGNVLLAEKYNLDKLRAHCISEAKQVHLSDLKAHPDFSKIKQPTLIELLMSMLEERDMFI